eukprot:TRINITY_DN13450_c1_g2_i4.p2 TRINITY_DN13450_c1_g2~~TRINITY_DN13450_c1_g2_i4.p2  ORF type:complete len:104 (-),score=3.91 TRINITY_DN13450_c1_g2_i4:20-331(-)
MATIMHLAVTYCSCISQRQNFFSLGKKCYSQFLQRRASLENLKLELLYPKLRVYFQKNTQVMHFQQLGDVQVNSFFFFLNITMWAGVPSEPLCLHTQSLATAH